MTPTCSFCNAAPAAMRARGEPACRSCYEANVPPWSRVESDRLDFVPPTAPPDPPVPAALARPVEDEHAYMASLAHGAASSVWSWSLTPWELRQQVEQYLTLPVTQSYRGIAALITAGSLLVTLLLSIFGVISREAALGVVLYAPIAWFIYKGHRWAMLTMIVLWTFEKGYTFYSRFPAGVGAVLFWYLFMKYYLAAFRVEQARRSSPSS